MEGVLGFLLIVAVSFSGLMIGVVLFVLNKMRKTLGYKSALNKQIRKLELGNKKLATENIVLKQRLEAAARQDNFSRLFGHNSMTASNISYGTFPSYTSTEMK